MLTSSQSRFCFLDAPRRSNSPDLTYHVRPGNLYIGGWRGEKVYYYSVSCSYLCDYDPDVSRGLWPARCRDFLPVVLAIALAEGSFPEEGGGTFGQLLNPVFSQVVETQVNHRPDNIEAGVLGNGDECDGGGIAASAMTRVLNALLDAFPVLSELSFHFVLPYICNRGLAHGVLREGRILILGSP